MGKAKQGARFSKDKVHAVFKDYIHELEEEKKKHQPKTYLNQLLYWRISSVEELYRRLRLGKI